MPEPHISADEAKQDKLFYVVANIIVINTDDETCLMLKRSESEKVLPGKYAFPGGKLEHSDVAKLLNDTGNEPLQGIDNILGKLAQRECEEECGLDVIEESTQLIKNKVFVRPDGVPVFMVTLAAKYRGGIVVLEDDAFTDFAWAKRDELDDYDAIPGINEEAAKAFDQLLN